MLVRLLTGTFLLGFGLLLGGCARSGLGPEGEVSGKVTYKGKPLPGGEIKFMSSKGYTFTGVIDPEGNYKLRVVVGEARIAVENQMLAEKSKDSPRLSHRNRPGVTPPPGKVAPEPTKSSAPTITGTYLPLPEKYRSFDASGLTCTVKSGSQTHNIELSD